MARLSISLLGSFQVTLDGRPVTGFESAKVRALLAFLAAEAGHAHSREALAELLWPDHPPGAALADLRHALSVLRKAIADASAHPSFLLITRTTLQINPASDASVDLADFAVLLKEGESSSLSACRAALALRRGPFLVGFSLSDSPQFEEWQVMMAERVDHLTGQALARLIRDSVQAGDFLQAIVWTRQQLALEPWNEEVHQQIIWQLAMSGQSAAALHHYDICRRQLAAELGVEPQAATQALVERIRNGERDFGLGGDVAPATSPTLPAPPMRPGNGILPPRPPVFFGRAVELSQVAARLADPDCRLLTVLGPGGMGKTLLAIEAARAQTENFADGVWFVDLSALNAPDLIADAILRALSLPPSGPGAASTRLAAHLQARQSLLVLDNFEHLLAGVDLLPRLLHAAPGLKLLITSRARLHLAEEWLLPLAGLATPPVSTVGTLPTDPTSYSEPRPLADFASLRLFLQRVQHLLPSFQPTPADLQQIAEICRLLEGMPLAIELAAGWVRTLSLAEIANAVRDRLDIFRTTLRDLPTRHRSMHAVFDHSWRLLDDRERSLLRQLSVFRGGCTLAAAAAVSGAAPADLESLVDKSWLRVHERRFSLHELTRQYCAEQLAQEHQSEVGEAPEEVYRRHCRYFAALTGAEEKALNWQREPMAVFTPDYGNLEAAWHWAVAHNDFAATRQMMTSLFFFAEMTGWIGAMLPFYESAIRALRTSWQQASDDGPQRQSSGLLLTNLLYIQAMLLMHFGWLTRVQNCLAESRKLLETMQHDTQWEEQDFWVRWAEVCLTQARGDFVTTHAETEKLLLYLQTNEIQCYPWRAEIGTRFWQASMVAMLGHVAYLFGDYPAALVHFERADSLRQAMGEQRFRAGNLRGVATVLRVTGAYEQALAVAHSALTLSQSLEDRLSAAYAELVLGQIEADAGRYLLAAEHCGRSLALAQETGEHVLLMRSLAELARVELAWGRPCAARERLEEAIAAFVQLGEPHSNHLAAVYIGFGQVACVEGDWPQARQMLRQALTTSGCGTWETLAAIAAMAEVEWGEGKREKAARLLNSVVAHKATAAHTRQRAEEMLGMLGGQANSVGTATGCISESPLTLEAVMQLV
jgi:predicted ATPase/DNA-binding SARP family transcriptional activator